MTGEAPISEREREILRLVAMGATNQQIAQQLDISINTVKVHLRNIFGKIGVASRTEATVYAIRQGLVVVGDRQPAADAAPMVAVADEPREELVATEAAPPATTAPAELPADVAPPEVPAVVPPAEPRPAVQRRGRTPVVVSAALALALGAGGLAYVLRQQQPAPAGAPTASAPDPEPARWRGRAELPRARSDYGLAPLDGRLYVMGGGGDGGASAWVDRYDPVNDVWVELPEKPTAARYVEAVTIGRRIYVPGGESSDGRALDVLEAYDARSQRWEQLAPLPAPRSRYALASLEGRLYLFGGWDGSRYCDDVFVYDPQAGSWSVDDQRLPTPRRSASAAASEGRIYVMGGEGPEGGLRANERYDPTGDSGRRWESLAPLSATVADPAAVAVVNVVLVFDPAARIALQYTPATDSWAAVSIPETTAVSSQAAFLGTSVFVFGGGGALSEYQAIYNTFLPGTTGSD